MNKVIKQALLESLQLTLESVAFLFVDPLDEAVTDLDTWEGIGVKILYKSEHSQGVISLYTEQDCIEVMCENVMGSISDATELQAKSKNAFKEILNIVAGNFLTNYFGTDIIFDLGIPEDAAKLISNPAPEKGEWVCVEECPFLISFEENNE